MKISLIILLFISTVMAQDRFEKLRVMKQSVQAMRVSKRSQEATHNKLLEIKYFDINNLNTDYLEKHYSLDLQQCIADGICIFKYNGKENMHKVIDAIQRNEKKISSVRKYQKYNFTLF